MTDGAAAESGWWVRNIDVGGTAIPTTLDGWQTQTQLNPDPVADWTVQLVSYGAKGDAGALPPDEAQRLPRRHAQR